MRHEYTKNLSRGNPAERGTIMNINYTILITVAVMTVAFVVAVIALHKLASKGVNVSDAVEKAGTALDYAQAIATAISPFLPSLADNIIAAVLKYAQQAVTHVEATYKAAIATGATATDTRQAEATSLIKSGLALQGIEVTPQIEKLINTVIPLLVLALPKTHTDTATVDTAQPATATSAQ